MSLMLLCVWRLCFLFLCFGYWNIMAVMLINNARTTCNKCNACKYDTCSHKLFEKTWLKLPYSPRCNIPLLWTCRLFTGKLSSLITLFYYSYYIYTFASVLQHCWLGDRKGIRSVKNWMLVCWWWWFDWSFAGLVAPVVTTTSIILSFSKTG